MPEVMADLACKWTYKTVIFVIFQPLNESSNVFVVNNNINYLSFNMMTWVESNWLSISSWSLFCKSGSWRKWRKAWQSTEWLVSMPTKYVPISCFWIKISWSNILFRQFSSNSACNDKYYWNFLCQLILKSRL